MSKQVVFTENAPRAVGPYSQAVIAGGMVFTAGQVGIDPAVGQLVTGGIREQAEQALKNIGAILEAAGSATAQVVKTTVFLQDMNDFAEMNSVYGEVFGENPPARSTVQVAKLPLGALVEIEAVALLER